jgi:hypothetical protein
MKQEAALIRRALENAARGAIAGILFRHSFRSGLLPFRLSARADPLEIGARLILGRTHSLWR